jgi:maltose O-acetyltransferase
MAIRALTVVRNFFAAHSVRQLVSLALEEYVGALLRSLPGFEGMFLRAVFYRRLFARLDGFAFLYPGVRLDHCHAIRAGRCLAINSGAYVSGRGGLTLGDNVLIGPNAVVVSSQHRWDLSDRPIIAQGHRMAPTTIGDDVWIGANAVVLPGVTIATGTVVSAGAVVTKSTEPYTIVGGVPATAIGRRPGQEVAGTEPGGHDLLRERRRP